MAVNETAGSDTQPRRRVGRPNASEAENKHLAMLEAALEEFSRHGFHGASVRAIAQRAGVSTRTLYNRYDDKLALFAASLEWSSAQNSWAPVASAGTLHEQLVQFATHMQTRLSQDRQVRLARVIFRECTSFPQLEAVSRKQFERHQIVPVQRILEAHGFTGEQAHEFAAIFVAMAFQRWQYSVIYDEPAPSASEMARHSETVASVFLGGVTAQTQRMP